MKKALAHPVVLWGSRWLLGIVSVAAWYKITDLVEFGRSISHYDMVLWG